MNGWDENHPIMGSAGGEPAPIISFFIGIITIIIALQRLPPVATNLFLFPPLGALGPSLGTLHHFVNLMHFSTALHFNLAALWYIVDEPQDEAVQREAISPQQG